MKKQTWYITGASKGLGLILVKKLLQQGHQVAATSRNAAELAAAVGEHADLLALEVQLTNEGSVQESLAQARERFGAIDIVVNNAGYGLIGAVEELTDEEVRLNFEVNVFGALNVVRHAAPLLRQQGSGHIFNIASIAGFSGAFPAFGIYCATKFAMHGFSESLAEELKPFGIGVTIVSPGYFRTNFLTSTSVRVPHNEIAAYTNVREVQRIHQQDINHNQPGDPEKAADLLIRMSTEANPPLHLFLGKDAYELAAQKIKNVEADMRAVESLATATGF